MPLKHDTETAYVLLLALAVALTGAVLAWLPPFPAGIVSWMLLLVATLLYPLLLMPGFKKNRADYQFRRLHLFPLLMVLVWGIVHGMGILVAPLGVLLLIYTFLWSLIPVAIGIGLLAWFCVAVVRQARLRITVIASGFAAFLLLSVVSHGMGWNEAIRAAIFENTILVHNPITALFEGREVPEVPLPPDGVPLPPLPPDDNDITVPPPVLPKSGGETEAMVLLSIAAYCALLHHRAKRRA